MLLFSGSLVQDFVFQPYFFIPPRGNAPREVREIEQKDELIEADCLQNDERARAHSWLTDITDYQL